MRNPARTSLGVILRNEVLLNSKRIAPYAMAVLFGANAMRAITCDRRSVNGASRLSLKIKSPSPKFTRPSEDSLRIFNNSSPPRA
jgi:hypothetical protein